MGFLFVPPRLVLYACCQGPVHLVIGNCFSWKTCILVRTDGSFILSTGDSERKHVFRKMEGKSFKAESGEKMAV